jgi:hypothetical protein
MKKYLMTGVAALAICAAFTSCSKSGDELYNPDVVKGNEAASIVEKYNQAFLKYVGGTIAPDQTWGFGGYSASAGTRGANTEGNIWFKTYERPYNVNLSSAEIDELKDLLSPGVETYNTEIFPHENYYVEQIYKGISADVAYDNNGNTAGTVTGSNQMDHLQARDGNKYEHINNFNYGGNNTEMVDEGNGTRYKGITLMKDMSLDGITATNQFGFSESFGTENGKFYNNYLIVHYKGEWYVGFDFEAHKSTATHNNGEQMQVNRNWEFTDWIVRISPAVAKIVDPDDVCIIAEDLSASDDTDFDFNDVVFTVHYTSATTADVTLYAAGGTLPLKVAGYEVHDKFGFPDADPVTGKYKMINTGAKADVNGVATKTFSVTGIDKSKRGNDIEIKVNKGTAEAPNWIELTATGGAPAAKLCVGVDFATGNKWCAERQSIKTKYPVFSEWVALNPTQIWWK